MPKHLSVCSILSNNLMIRCLLVSLWHWGLTKNLCKRWLLDYLSNFVNVIACVQTLWMCCFKSKPCPSQRPKSSRWGSNLAKGLIYHFGATEKLFWSGDMERHHAERFYMLVNSAMFAVSVAKYPSKYNNWLWFP